MNRPVSGAEFDGALRQLKRALADVVVALRVFSRLAQNGMVAESARLDQNADDIARLRAKIAKKTELARKLKQREQRRRDIEQERKRLGSK